MPLAASAGSLAADAGGVALVVVAVGDIFLTIFNYDGYTTLTTWFHRGWWRTLRTAAAVLPDRPRHFVLSVGSASMLPATVGLWLGLEIAGFGLLYHGGIASGELRRTGASASFGTAFYLSGGDISSLTFETSSRAAASTGRSSTSRRSPASPPSRSRSATS